VACSWFCGALDGGYPFDSITGQQVFDLLEHVEKTGLWLGPWAGFGEVLVRFSCGIVPYERGFGKSFRERG
jgi:hypothetical protein